MSISTYGNTEKNAPSSYFYYSGFDIPSTLSRRAGRVGVDRVAVCGLARTLRGTDIEAGRAGRITISMPFCGPNTDGAAIGGCDKARGGGVVVKGRKGSAVDAIRATSDARFFCLKIAINTAAAPS